MKTAIELKANVDDSEINNFALSLYTRRAIYKEKFIIGGENHLCKAKRTDNGKWVEGFYFCMTHPNGRHTQDFIIPLGAELSPGTPIEKIQVEVDSDTICWCTGLKDDNGILIFENNILFLKDEITEYEWKAVVKFGNPNAEYNWGWQLVPITECDANKDILLWVETKMDYMQCKIIGSVIGGK